MNTHWSAMAITRWEKNNGRYYKAILQKDLLNDWTLTLAWGGINSRLGNYSNHVFKTKNEAEKFIELLNQKRTRRGYLLVGRP